MPNRYLPLTKCLLIIILLSSNFSAIAQLSASLKLNPLFKKLSFFNLSKYPDSALSKYSYSPALVALPAVKEPEVELMNNLADAIKEPQERKKLLNYLKNVDIKSTPAASQAKKRFYYHLANTFARLRLYPLAMKCFLKTVPKPPREANKKLNPLPDYAADRDTDLIDNGIDQYLTINGKDDSLINNYTADFKQNRLAVKSKAITYQRIRQTFDDGKRAVAYAMLFHVKQPVRGKRKIFVFNNVGHTFITLIKYNSDSTYTSVSLGFYPKKDNLLSATPLIPSTSSTFKDDSRHDWDEVLGRFISKRKFERIQGLILQYNGVKYNLSKNNCTDFGIKAAELAGISMHETYGTWPLGSGNNPAVTGQSILEHKFTNADFGNTEGIFMDALADMVQ